MGGKAFRRFHDISTPRMPPDIYSQALTSTKALLLEHFDYVSSPLEAPGKTDYGDVDLVVCDAKNPLVDVKAVAYKKDVVNLAGILGARRYSYVSGNPNISFAVSWPIENGEGEAGNVAEREDDVEQCALEEMDATDSVQPHRKKENGADEVEKVAQHSETSHTRGNVIAHSLELSKGRLPSVHANKNPLADSGLLETTHKAVSNSDGLLVGQHWNQESRDKTTASKPMSTVVNNDTVDEAQILDIKEAGEGSTATDSNKPLCEAEIDSGRCIQVDIHLCFTRSSFEWTLFHQAHGDFWSILGSTIRPLGLTINNKGLHLRIPNIELDNRKRSFILLTADPSDILDFLGLDVERFWRKFDTLDEMFEYIASCRMFGLRTYETNDVQEADALSGVSKDDIEEKEEKLARKDRKKLNQRPVFKKWMDEFVPACREAGRLGNTDVTRASVRDEAFARYQGVKSRFESRATEWEWKKQNHWVWNIAIRDYVPLPEDVDPGLRAASIRMLKKVLMQGEADVDGTPKAARRDEKGFLELEVVKDYVRENWERLGKEGLKRQEEMARKGMREKEEKRAKERERQSNAENRGV